MTTIGGHVGLGVSTCEPGDLVCILLGCSTPMIFRAKGEAFVLVGEAYLHGFMDGEAMKGLKEGRYVMRDFGLL